MRQNPGHKRPVFVRRLSANLAEWRGFKRTMKKISLALVLLPFILCACKKDEVAADGKTTTPPATSTSGGTDAGKTDLSAKVVGTFKVDMTGTTFPMESEKDKQEAEAMRVEFKADGTYALSGSQTDTGKWTVAGTSMTLKSDKPKDETPGPFDVSEDGSKLSWKMPKRGDKEYMMVFVKE